MADSVDPDESIWRIFLAQIWGGISGPNFSQYRETKSQNVQKILNFLFAVSIEKLDLFFVSLILPSSIQRKKLKNTD